MKVPGSGVITQSLPRVQHFILRGCCQNIDRRESLQPAVVEWNHSSDLRLLQHDLRHENRVGIRCMTPRKMMEAVPRIPAQYFTTKRWNFVFRHEINVQRPAPNVQRSMKSPLTAVGR